MSGKRYVKDVPPDSTRLGASTARYKGTLTTRQIQVISFLIQLILVAYGEYHDRHSVLKYTDVDYRVFSDAVHALWMPSKKDGNIAQGPLTRWMGWEIGDPYKRSTYRYTPLLAVLLSPIHLLPSSLGPLFGKLLFSFVSSFTIPDLLIRLGKAEHVNARPQFFDPYMTTLERLIHGIWTLNPIILNINTRGSSESLLVVLVLGALVSLSERRLRACAILWAASIHWKLYPVIFASSIFLILQRWDDGWLWTRRKVHFGLWSVGTFGLLSFVCWLIWGYPFLEHAFLYHATRLDHRHNFSAYFYPIYLQMFSDPASEASGVIATLSTVMDRVARHPLSSFFPQFSLAIGSGLLLPASSASITFTWFIQTLVFVTFNKVCTSQYFIWYLFFLPVAIPQLQISLRRSILCIGLWVASQALWLSTAYRLEFLGQNVYMPLWAASLGFLAVNTWCIGVLVDSYQVSAQIKRD